jgi:hypothetical protein
MLGTEDEWVTKVVVDRYGRSEIIMDGGTANAEL